MTERALTLAQKRELLEKLLSQRSAEERSEFPLSHGQRALWFVHRIVPASAAYNIGYALAIRSELDTGRLNACVQALAVRHPALRTTFGLRDGVPLQRVATATEVPFDIIECPQAGRVAQFDRLRAELRKPFDLERGPVLRALLLRIDRAEHVLLLAVHHIVSDYWSMSLLAEELREFYAARSCGRAPRLTSNVSHYGRHVELEASWAESPAGRTALEVWRARLEPPPIGLELLTDRRRPAASDFAGATHEFRVPVELVQRLEALAGAESVTLFTLLLTAFQALLCRHTGRTDVVVGTSTSGRMRPEFAHTVGFFVNALPLRANFEGDPTFRQMLRSGRERVFEALENQEYPFPLLVERTRSSRDDGRTPLFQAMFGYQRDPRAERAPAPRTASAAGADGELLFDVLPLPQQEGQFELNLQMHKEAGELVGWLQYRTELYDAERIRRLASSFRALLCSVVADVDTPIADLEVLAPEDRRELLGAWNDTAAEYPREQCVHDLFAAQVRRTPAAAAVIEEGTVTTFAELDRRARVVAARLSRLGVQADDRVALYVERSELAIVAVLGVLQSGAAYLPLDRLSPPQRLVAILEDAAPRAILTTTWARASLPAYDAPILELEQVLRECEAEPGPKERAASGPSNLAYVIYTSGSTGTPKGVMVPHTAVVNYLSWALAAYGADRGGPSPLHSALSFDLTVTSLLLPLVAGAGVVVVPETAGLLGLYAALPEGADRCLIKLTPAHLEILNRAVGEQPCGGRARLLVLGGEALHAETLVRWRSAVPATRLINEYGPTEATVGCCVHEVGPTDADSGPVPIGRPIANTSIHLLDARGRLVPVGVAGEIHIGGAGLANGYLGRPDLSAERFVHDPFASAQGTRLYRSGDIARRRADGALEYLGRMDRQVKLRGMRIEPGEIEQAAARHLDVERAAVVLRSARGEREQLIAYYTCAPGRRVAPASLREFMLGALPAYMVPAGLFELPDLPLTTNGKVDYLKLSEPAHAEAELLDRDSEPRDEIERALAAIWCDALSLERVGVRQNYFDLGGASLQSLEIAQKASRVGLAFTPELLLSYPTIAELAVALKSRKRNTVEAVLLGPAEPERAEPATPWRDTAPIGTRIESLGCYLPSRVVSTQQVLAGCARPLDFPMQKLTGICNRRVVGEAEYSIDLARRAAQDCLSRSRHVAADIDLVIACNISRLDAENWFSLEPGTAIKLKAALGLERALAFDVGNACAGLFTAIHVANAFLRGGAIRRALIISGEYVSHLYANAQREIVSAMDPQLASLTVGDAGVALILEAGGAGAQGFQALDLYTLGRYSSFCISHIADGPNGGAIMLTDAMRQTAVAIRHSVLHSARVLERAHWNASEIDQIIMHQTSQTAIRDAARAINLHHGASVCTDENVILNLAERGNTATTSHMVALADGLRQGRFRNGDRIVFAITGSGQVIGTALYVLDDLAQRMHGVHAPAEQETRDAVPARPGAHTSSMRVRITSSGVAEATPDAPSSALDLAAAASEACLHDAATARDDVDLLLYAGVYRDRFLSEPALAAMLAGRLELRADIAPTDERKTLAFDVLNGGVGFLDACRIAVELIQTGAHRRALVVAAEIDHERGAAGGRQDGLREIASALLLEAGPEHGQGFGAFGSEDRTDGVRALVSGARNDGHTTRLHVQREPSLDELWLAAIPSAVERALAADELSLRDVQVVLPPRDGQRFRTLLAARLGVDEERIASLGQDGGDSFTSGFVFGLHAARAAGLVRPGAIGLAIAVGSGVQVRCAVYRF